MPSYSLWASPLGSFVYFGQCQLKPSQQTYLRGSRFSTEITSTLCKYICLVDEIEPIPGRQNHEETWKWGREWGSTHFVLITPNEDLVLNISFQYDKARAYPRYVD